MNTRYALYLIVDGKRQAQPIAAGKNLADLEKAIAEHLWFDYDVVWQGDIPEILVCKHRMEV